MHYDYHHLVLFGLLTMSQVIHSILGIKICVFNQGKFSTILYNLGDGRTRKHI